MEAAEANLSELVQGLVAGTAGRGVRFAASARLLETRLRAIRGPTERRAAVRTLARFGIFLARTEGSEQAGHELLRALEDAVVGAKVR